MCRAEGWPFDDLLVIIFIGPREKSQPTDQINTPHQPPPVHESKGLPEEISLILATDTRVCVCVCACAFVGERGDGLCQDVLTVIPKHCFLSNTDAHTHVHIQ